jgi:hypothetical protein
MKAIYVCQLQSSLTTGALLVEVQSYVPAHIKARSCFQDMVMLDRTSDGTGL